MPDTVEELLGKVRAHVQLGAGISGVTRRAALLALDEIAARAPSSSTAPRADPRLDDAREALRPLALVAEVMDMGPDHMPENEAFVHWAGFAPLTWGHARRALAVFRDLAPEQPRADPAACKAEHPGSGSRCQRDHGHSGVHRASMGPMTVTWEDDPPANTARCAKCGSVESMTIETLPPLEVCARCQEPRPPPRQPSEPRPLTDDQIREALRQGAQERWLAENPSMPAPALQPSEPFQRVHLGTWRDPVVGDPACECGHVHAGYCPEKGCMCPHCPGRPPARQPSDPGRVSFDGQMTPATPEQRAEILGDGSGGWEPAPARQPSDTDTARCAKCGATDHMTIETLPPTEACARCGALFPSSPSSTTPEKP